MRNADKKLLRQLAKQGKTLIEIREYLDVEDCTDATIKKYIKVLGKSNVEHEALRERKKCQEITR